MKCQVHFLETGEVSTGHYIGTGSENVGGSSGVRSSDGFSCGNGDVKLEVYLQEESLGAEFESSMGGSSDGL